MTRRLLLFLPHVLLVAGSVYLSVHWTASGALPIIGDEPHYLITSASVVRDGDLDVANNYEYENSAREVFPSDLVPHAFRDGPHLWPQRMPGVSVLLAIPFGLGGALGARAALPLLIIPVLAIAVYRWCRSCLGPLDAAVASAGVLACSPVVFGASQIYPDLLVGTAALTLLGWLWGSERHTYLGWCVYWCAAGLFCWLHVKYYAATAVLAALGVWQLRRDGDPRFTPASYLTFGGLLLAGPALFWTFSVPAFGNIMGGRGSGELNFGFLQALELFVGLHIDQVHGLFVQQPILLPGLVALGWMIRRRHLLTLPWLVLYASLIAPNALQHIPYGGHIAPAGRYGWSAMWLWLVPMAIVIRELRGQTSFSRAVRLTVLAGVAYQAVLAFQWLPVPQRLFNGLFAPGMWQPSLFPHALMLSLPKLGPHADLAYFPNLVWTAGALSLVAAGWLRSSRWRYLPLLATAVVAVFLLPVEDTLDRSNTVPRRYEAEETPQRCTVLPRGGASNGRICRQNANNVYAVAGPFITLEPGQYQIIAAVRHATERGDGVLDVVANRGHEFIVRHDFQLIPAPGWTFATADFAIDRTTRDVEFRLRGLRGVEVDYIELRRSSERRSTEANARTRPSALGVTPPDARLPFLAHYATSVMRFHLWGKDP